MSNQKLVDHLMYNNYLKTKKVIDAFLSVPREHFVQEEHKQHAYSDEPLPIGFKQTISAPSMVAIMLELLNFKPKQNILEIGTGSGWNAALMSKLADPSKIYTIEIIPELAKFAKKNMERAGIENVEIIENDGGIGHKKQQPYDIIILTCAAQEVPEELLKQLKIGGTLMAPVGGLQQILTKIERTKNGFEKTRHCGCVFVPLRRYT